MSGNYFGARIWTLACEKCKYLAPAWQALMHDTKKIHCPHTKCTFKILYEWVHLALGTTAKHKAARCQSAVRYRWVVENLWVDILEECCSHGSIKDKVMWHSILHCHPFFLVLALQIEFTHCGEITQWIPLVFSLRSEWISLKCTVNFTWIIVILLFLYEWNFRYFLSQSTHTFHWFWNDFHWFWSDFHLFYQVTFHLLFTHFTVIFTQLCY
jgi:hypothetical protein